MPKQIAPAAAAEIITEVTPAESWDAAAGALLSEARATSETMTQADLAETLQINQMLGLVAYTRALDSVNKVTQLKALQRIKNSKSYKTMVVLDPDGGLLKPKTWEGLCKALNLSRSKVDEDLENLAIFGEKLLEEQKALGIGYRDLRALRAGLSELPAQEAAAVQDMIAAAAASGDKEEILATLDELGARNAKLSKELAGTKKDLKAKADLQAKTTTKVNELEIRLEQALNPGSEDERQRNLADARAALRETLDGDCNSLIGLVTAICNRIGNTRKADTDGADEPIINAEVWEYLNARLVLTCDAMRHLVQSAGLDWYGPEYAAPDYRLPGDADDNTPETTQ